MVKAKIENTVYQKYAEHIKQMHYHNDEASYRYNQSVSYEFDFNECPEITNQDEYIEYQYHRNQRNVHQHEASKIKDEYLDPYRIQIQAYMAEIDSSEDKENKSLLKKYTAAREKLSREEHKFDNAVRRACGEKTIPYNKSFYVEVD